jgi:hypothetical protein
MECEYSWRLLQLEKSGIQMGEMGGWVFFCSGFGYMEYFKSLLCNIFLFLGWRLMGMTDLCFALDMIYEFYVTWKSDLNAQDI